MAHQGHHIKIGGGMHAPFCPMHASTHALSGGGITIHTGIKRSFFKKQEPAGQLENLPHVFL